MILTYALGIFIIVLILLLIFILFFFKKGINNKSTPSERKVMSVIDDANKKAEDILDQAKFSSDRINQIYTTLSTKFEEDIKRLYDEKLKQIENNIKIKGDSIDNINNQFIKNLEESVNNFNTKSDDFKKMYDKALADFERSLNLLFQDISERTQNNLSNFSKMNLELYDKDLAQIEENTTKIISDMVEQERAKFTSLSDQIKEESQKMREDLVNTLNKDAAIVVSRVVKEVLNLSLDMNDQEEYIFDTLNKHIEEIKNGL